MPASWRRRAVPPVERISTPASARARARSSMPRFVQVLEIGVDHLFDADVQGVAALFAAGRGAVRLLPPL